ncbi:MAG: hypothetical protein MRERV_3c039 [Mycoplasmataceae bacterium RV_VA103A]|nr:MAG: hypothetical protein MRERV_3c039 [Mycoplasmataceae bacterium RV_VA103A]
MAFCLYTVHRERERERERAVQKVNGISKDCSFPSSFSNIF